MCWLSSCLRSPAISGPCLFRHWPFYGLPPGPLFLQCHQTRAHIFSPNQQVPDTLGHRPFAPSSTPGAPSFSPTAWSPSLWDQAPSHWTQCHPWAAGMPKHGSSQSSSNATTRYAGLAISTTHVNLASSRQVHSVYNKLSESPTHL